MLRTYLDPHFDIEKLLFGLPEGSVVIDLNCSDWRTVIENFNKTLQLKEDAPNAHVYPITVPGAARPLMDPSEELDIARDALKYYINLIAGDALSTVMVITIHELCKAYSGLHLDRAGLTARMLEEVTYLPGNLHKMLGDNLKGILVFHTLLDNEGKDAEGTQFVGGTSTQRN